MTALWFFVAAVVLVVLGMIGSRQSGPGMTGAARLLVSLIVGAVVALGGIAALLVEGLR